MIVLLKWIINFLFISVGEILCQEDECVPRRNTDLQEMEGSAFSRCQANKFAGKTAAQSSAKDEFPD